MVDTGLTNPNPAKVDSKSREYLSGPSHYYRTRSSDIYKSSAAYTPASSLKHYTRSQRVSGPFDLINSNHGDLDVVLWLSWRFNAIFVFMLFFLYCLEVLASAIITIVSMCVRLPMHVRLIYIIVDDLYAGCSIFLIHFNTSMSY